jgi:hypothetical protein
MAALLWKWRYMAVGVVVVVVGIMFVVVFGLIL